MKTSIVGFDFDSGTTTIAPDAATLATWAAEAHEAVCPTCRNAERCPAGQRYADAARNSNDDIPGYRA